MNFCQYFECTAGNLGEFNETIPLTVLPSYDINGFTHLDFLDPSEVDDLIEERTIKDVSNKMQFSPFLHLVL